MKRYVSLWFRHLATDMAARRWPALRGSAFVLVSPERGRLIIQAASAAAEKAGIVPGMALADARTLNPRLAVLDDDPVMAAKCLEALAEWSIRYTPVAAVEPPDGLVLDASGCAHLWGGEQPYLKDILTRLQSAGYAVRGAMAGTLGAAWALARYGHLAAVIDTGQEKEALWPLPPEALRLEPAVLDRLHKLGLHRIGSFVDMPRSVLFRRFGQQLLNRIDQALGKAAEDIRPIRLTEPYREYLPCPEPIRTATGIEMALLNLLHKLCRRLAAEGKGLRQAILSCCGMEGDRQQIGIGTLHPMRDVRHLWKLFELKIAGIAPGLGIELFILEAPLVEDLSARQEHLWADPGGLGNSALSCLLDRLAARAGPQAIHRFLPHAHHWPERSLQPAASLAQTPSMAWPADVSRPIHLLQEPERITASAPLPDYPPVHFIHQGRLHKIRKADGPERIAREWWIDEGPLRDYYCVEDEQGARYWLFRSGHDQEPDNGWYLHGYFA